MAFLATEKINLIARASAKLAEKQLTRKCETSLLDFAEYCWPVVEPAIPFVRGWVLEAIAEHLEAVSKGQIKRLLVNVPPGFTKSLMTDVFWPAWEWGPLNRPSLRYVCASYSNHLTIRDNMRCRNIITSDRYQRLWGHRFGIDRAQFDKIKFGNDKTGWKLATSIGGVGVGERGDRFICFPYNELVHTKQGLRKIGELVDLHESVDVLSFDTGTGRSCYKPIIGWHKNPASPLVRVVISDGSSVLCTPGHRFWSGGRWVPASELVPNDLLSVARQPQTLSYRSPTPSSPDSKDGARANPVSGSQNIGSFSAVHRDFTSLMPIQDSPRPLFKDREGSVALGIRDILRSSAIFQVVSSIIGRVPVFVTNIIVGIRSWPQKGQCYDDMAFVMEGLVVAPQINTHVPFIRTAALQALRDGLFQNPFFSDARPNVTSDFSGQAFDSSVTGSFVERESRNRDPALHVIRVDDGGHADSTYCLSVKDTHTFCVGRMQPIITRNCDDPNNTMEMESETTRYTTNMWFTEVVPDRLNNQSESAIVVIQQRLHEEDISGVAISRNMGYTHLMVPMEYDEKRHCVTVIGVDNLGNEVKWEDPRSIDGDIAWPERFPPDVIRQLKNDKGPYAWSGQYQQSPAPRGGAILLEDHWKLWEAEQYPDFEFILASLDTAYTEKQENDPSALTIWGIFRENGAPKIMLLHAWQQRLAINELVPRVIDSCTRDNRPILTPRFKVDRLLIESKAAGISVAQEISRLIGFTGQFGIELINPQKHGDKVARVHSIQHLFSEGLVYAPDKDWADMVIQQAAVFPRGSHDDLVDSLSMALRYMRDVGLLLRKDEHDLYETSKLEFKGRTQALYPA